MKDSSGETTISHKGIVQKSDNESVTVLITAESACKGCHAEGSCTLSGTEEKIIEVKGSFDVRNGDTVTVMMKQSTGFNALFLGYLLPLVIVITLLILLAIMKYSELASGLLAISSLLPYYLILYLLRKRINDKFIFSLKI
ncbi:MAG: SoxR reducing system RseC family protein [Bacteroidetes bacterium]|nr:SoxR reducing system RseC family protein [Bacteroidota bacterium]